MSQKFFVVVGLARHFFQSKPGHYILFLFITFIIDLFIINILGPTGSYAHHGGLVVESEGEGEYQEDIQWKQEVRSNGYRLKFLSYPQTIFIKESIRLVFEVQLAETGFYVSGLEAKINIKEPDGKEKSLPANEQKGVAGYYETKNLFTQEGEHIITFQSGIDDLEKIIGIFKEETIDKEKIGYWYRLIGRAVVLLAALVTLLGTVSSFLFNPRSHWVRKHG